MIGQLVRTRFESNLMSFVVFVALIVAATARFLMTREVPQGPVPQQQIIMAAAWLMLSLLAAGIVSLLRQNRERSGRLYAQLPVSPRQIRVTYWLHVTLYPAIAALLLHAFVLFGGSEPAAAGAQLVSVGLFVSACLWLACFSLVTNNIARLIPQSIRANTVLYCCVVALATIILGFGLIIAVRLIGGEGFEDERKMFPVLALLWAALVVLDIYLYAKKDLNLD
jgi:hypothetical protein